MDLKFSAIRTALIIFAVLLSVFMIFLLIRQVLRSHYDCRVRDNEHTPRTCPKDGQISNRIPKKQQERPVPTRKPGPNNSYRSKPLPRTPEAPQTPIRAPAEQSFFDAESSDEEMDRPRFGAKVRWPRLSQPVKRFDRSSRLSSFGGMLRQVQERAPAISEGATAPFRRALRFSQLEQAAPPPGEEVTIVSTPRDLNPPRMPSPAVLAPTRFTHEAVAGGQQAAAQPKEQGYCRLHHQQV